MTDYLKELNDAQREAVTNHQGPSLVIAGAGSGKTRVLTYRIAHLLSLGIPAGSILALTFTNKAAKEMKERIASIVGYNTAKYLWMGTFHSIFAKILRTEADKLGFTSNFTIYDTVDSKSVIKNIIKDLQLDDQTYKIGEVSGRISSAKNNLITAQAYFSNQQLIAWDKKSRKPRISDIYKLYALRCKKADAMDFDDLLLFTNILMRDHPDVLQKYQQYFQYILVDEYQDTNYAQYLIVKKLGDLHHNVCVVGDDAQSIYSFRGAKIENILNFKNDYRDFKLYKLEQNYRSTQTIVNAANSVIGKNQEQIRKKVWSANETGDKIKVIRTITDLEEGNVVSNSIMEERLNFQQDYKDFAILYRTNAQSRIFEEALRKRNIPYKIYGSISFYQRKEIKDLLAYFRLIVNANDDEAFRRIINYPARGIGATTLTRLQEAAYAGNLSLWEVLINAATLIPELNKGTLTKLQNFRSLIREFTEKAHLEDAYDLALQVANKSGILKEFYKENTPENISKYENLQELLNGIREFSEQAQEENTEPLLVHFLENVSLLTDADKESAEDFNKVSLMTMHAAKGLEFNTVYVAGLEEDLFPNKMAANTAKELEEERRLFYVAITRAKKKAFITYTSTRYKWGVPTPSFPSRFIKDIDNQYVELPADFHGHIVYDEHEESPVFTDNTSKTGKKEIKKTFPGPAQKLLNISNANHKIPDPSTFQHDDPVKIKTGMTVEHQRFGQGKVLEMEGQFPNTKATVFFPQTGKKQLLLKFARLRIIDEI